MSFDLLTCTLISDLRSQGLFQTQEKFQVLQPLIFFWVSALKKTRFIVYTVNLKKKLGGHLDKKTQVLKT